MKKLSKKLRAAWVEIWMDTMRRTGNEGKAFTAANGVVKRAEEGDMSGAGDKGSKPIKEKDVDPSVGGGVDRDKLEDGDFAWPETRSFPIVKPGDVSDAASSIGRFKGGKATDEERAALKANIIRIARRKGGAFVKELPQAWKDEDAAEESTVGERKAVYDGLKAADVPEAKRPAWDAEMAKLDALFEVGRRHSQSDIEIIDKCIAMLQELRRNEMDEPLSATEADDGKAADQSFDQKAERVRRAFEAQFPSGDRPVVPSLWPNDVFPDKVIVTLGSDSFEVAYSEEEGKIVFADRSEWTKVKRKWVPATEAAKSIAEQDADADEDKGGKPMMAYCMQCKKKMPLLDAKETTVAGRQMVKGKCEKGHAMTMMTGAEESARTQYVSEGVPLAEAPLDEDAHEVELTLIRPGWSQNDRYYSPEVLRAAAKLFEGCKAYADHPRKSDDADRPERSIRDVVGYYPKVWLGDDGAIKGRLRVVGEAVGWLWPLITETVRNAANLVFSSINALGKVKPGEVDGRKGMVVEGIVKANSADVVTQAAAGGRFERLLASDGGFTDDLLAALDYDGWLAARPDHAMRLKDEMKTARREELAESARLEADGLRAKLAEGEANAAVLNGRVTELGKALETERDGFDAKIREAAEAKDAEVAALRQEMAARDAAHQAETLILKANVPDVIQESVRQKVTEALAKGDEDGAKRAIEDERGKLRKAVASETVVGVKGGGQAASPMQSNVVAEALGVGVVPLEGETADQYGQRKRRIMEAKKQ